MDLKKIKEQASDLAEKEKNFSALFLWKVIVEDEMTSFNLFNLGDSLRLCGFLSEAEHIFSKINPDDIPASKRFLYYLFLGQILKDKNEIDSARAAFQKCIELDDTSTVPYIYLASTYNFENENENAIQVLNKAKGKSGDLDEVYYNLSNRLAVQGELNMAITYINECLRLDPEYPDANKLRGDLVRLSQLKNEFTDAVRFHGDYDD